MAHGLYRFYLYFVLIAMLILAAVGGVLLLQPLLSLTALRGAYSSPPSSASLTQAFVFAVTSWVIAGLLGGLHYWLIRRDQRSDPQAGNSASRAFFLNITELVVAPLAIGFAAFGFIQQLGYSPASDVTYFAAFALMTGALLIFLEWERQRAPATLGGALTLQRLHLYGVQLILLLLLTTAWLRAGHVLLDELAFGGRVSGVAPCAGFTGCQSVNLLSLVASVLLIAAFWIGYGYFNRAETGSFLRRILYFASFAYGVVFLVLGLWVALDLLLRLLLGQPVTASDVLFPSNLADFASLLSFGVLVIGVYTCWLRVTALREAADAWAVTLAVLRALVTGLLAASFWWGTSLLLFHAFNWLLPTGHIPGVRDWTWALALVIVGLAYIPLDLSLRSLSQRTPAIAGNARRGYLFAHLGGGLLALAIGGAIALYAWGTALLGSPLSDWTQPARGGLAATLAGACVLGLALWNARQAGIFQGQPKPPVPPAPVPQPAPAIEAILDALLAGAITRTVAAERLQALIDVPKSVAATPVSSEPTTNSIATTS